MTQNSWITIEPLIPALRRYARALLRNPWDADDLVQDCLERAVRRWHQRRDDSSTRAWLFAILHNLAMTRLHRAFRQARTVAFDEADVCVTVRPTQEEHVHCQDVIHALAHLPDEQRSVLLLVAVEDLSYAEAANVLDIPLGTVMSRLSRARDRLHRMLSEKSTYGTPSRRAHLHPVKTANHGE